MRHSTRRRIRPPWLGRRGGLALPAPLLRAASPNEAINLGFISCGGRAGELMGAFGKIAGVRIAGLCDPDQERLGKAKQKHSRRRKPGPICGACWTTRASTRW